MSADAAALAGVDGVDLDALRSWLDGQGVGWGPIEQVRALGGGTQNVLVSFVRDGSAYVLRRPPLAKRPHSDSTLRREARVLAALAGTDVPHARLVAACPDVEPLGAAFVVTEHVVGVSLWDEGPPPWSEDVEVQHRAGLAVVDAFAALARVDVDAVGLADLSRSDGRPAARLERWRAQLASYGGEPLPHAEALHRWLLAERPGTLSRGLVHGDAHLGNVLLRPDGTGVAALVDWELAGLGDPLLDLGQLLATWPLPGSAFAARVDAAGLPSEEEVVRRWAATSGRSTETLPWCRALAGYRLAVLLEGTHARARAGQAAEETGLLLHGRALALLRDAALAVGIEA